MMSREDLMRNLGIARSQLAALRAAPLDAPRRRIDAVQHVLDMVEAEMSATEPAFDFDDA